MRKTESPILAAVHDTAKGLFKAGAMDQITLREFDQLCLPPVEPLQPEQIKHIREASRVSQAVSRGKWGLRCAWGGTGLRQRFAHHFRVLAGDANERLRGTRRSPATLLPLLERAF